MPTTRARLKGPDPTGRITRSRKRAGTSGIRDDDSVRLVRKVRAGLKFSLLTQFQKATSLPLEKIAHYVQIPLRTLTRRQQEGRLRPAESDRLLRVRSLFDKATQLFEGDAEAATRWLETPQPAFDGESPFEFATTEVGAREVESFIVRLEHGVFA